MFSFVNFKSGLLLHLHDLEKGDTNQKSLGFLFVGWDSYFSWKFIKIAIYMGLWHRVGKWTMTKLLIYSKHTISLLYGICVVLIFFNLCDSILSFLLSSICRHLNCLDYCY